MAKSLSRQAKNHTDANGRVATGKKVAVTAVEVVVEAVTTAAEAVQEHVITPAAEAVGVVKTKKARFVRERAEKKPQGDAPALPVRSTKAGGKLMSKNLAVKPKDVRTGKPEGGHTGKPKV